VKVCEEVKKEHMSTRFCDVSYLYFHKNDLRIVSDCIDTDLGGWGGVNSRGHAHRPSNF